MFSEQTKEVLVKKEISNQKGLEKYARKILLGLH